MTQPPKDAEAAEPGEAPRTSSTALAVGAKAAMSAPPAAISLGSGRRLETETDGDVDVIRVRARSGECVLTVRVTDEGPVLSFSGAALEIATRSLDIACETLRVRSTAGADIDIGGDVKERVAGSVVQEIQGALVTQARSVAMASEGGVDVRANDDVSLKGERVLLNSDDPPLPLTWEEYQARHPDRARLEGGGKEGGGS
jgi:hypothetical protein